MTFCIFILALSASIIPLELVFGAGDYGLLESMDLLSVFRTVCTGEIVQHTAISAQRVTNVQVLEGSVHFYFDLLQASQELRGENNGLNQG